jgi:uncharacterized protein
LKSGIIQTYTGKRVDVFRPSFLDIDILDIAHSLSLLNRFNGHVDRGYSVGEHSVFVSYIVNPKYALKGLLHDATECYIGDCVSPLKKLLAEYQIIEERIWIEVCKKFNLSMSKRSDRAVKVADEIALMTEAKSFGVTLTTKRIHDRIRPLDILIKPLTAKKSERLFLQRFRELWNENLSKSSPKLSVKELRQYETQFFHLNFGSTKPGKKITKPNCLPLLAS